MLRLTSLEKFLQKSHAITSARQVKDDAVDAVLSQYFANNALSFTLTSDACEPLVLAHHASVVQHAFEALEPLLDSKGYMVQAYPLIRVDSQKHQLTVSVEFSELPREQREAKAFLEVVEQGVREAANECKNKARSLSSVVLAETLGPSRFSAETKGHYLSQFNQACCGDFSQLDSTPLEVLCLAEYLNPEVGTALDRLDFAFESPACRESVNMH